jgi:hypothetical protein
MTPPPRAAGKGGVEVNCKPSTETSTIVADVWSDTASSKQERRVMVTRETQTVESISIATQTENEFLNSDSLVRRVSTAVQTCEEAREVKNGETSADALKTHACTELADADVELEEKEPAQRREVSNHESMPVQVTNSLHVSKLNPEATVFLPTETLRSQDTFFGPLPDEVYHVAKVEPVSLEEGPSRSFYLSGELEDQKVQFLLDSGAEVSVIGPEVLARLPRETRLKFLKNDCIVGMVDGTRVGGSGPVLCRLRVADREVLEKVCALHCSTDTILGAPGMLALGCQWTVAGVEVCNTPHAAVFARQLRLKNDGKVRLMENVEVPALSETVVVGRVGRVLNGRSIVIEPVPHKDSERSYIVGRSVNIPEDQLLQVRVCNLTSEPILLKKDMVLAEAQLAQVLQVEPGASEIGGGEIPPHLRQLWETTCTRENLSAEYRERLRQLLCKFGKLFATGDDDLGRTTVVTHDIDTGDALPSRVPPRRVPESLLSQHDKEMERMEKQVVISPGQSPCCESAYTFTIATTEVRPTNWQLGGG